MRIIYIFIVIYSLSLNAKILEYDIKPKDYNSNSFMGINILDSKELQFEPINGIEVTELSALAYRDRTLYALSDKGYLYHFSITIKNKKIESLTLKSAFELKNRKKKRLSRKKRDAEGLSLFGDMLLISFERVPRVEIFSLNGLKLKSKKIHKSLRDSKNYQSKNKMLEAVAYSKKYGIITAPELPLKGSDAALHTLYAKKRVWKFKLSGSLTALEFIDEDNILILQRAFNTMSRRRVITLSCLNLKKSNSLSKQKILAIFDTSDGWSIDNFEGLTKIEDNLYLMVSDDNNSIFQKTLLVLFEISR